MNEDFDRPSPLGDPPQVRLPELEIFRKYSLALRREFADPVELMELLKVSYVKAKEAAGAASSGTPARANDTGGSPGAGDQRRADGPPDSYDDSYDGTSFSGGPDAGAGAGPAAGVRLIDEDPADQDDGERSIPFWELEKERKKKFKRPGRR